jgi:type IV pilus assembly protein PilN
MIRINLLATDRKTDGKKAKASSAGASSGGGGGLQTAYLFLGLFSALAVALCAAGWWIKDLQIKELDAQIQVATKRQAELQAIKKQVEDFQAKERLLTEKVNLIERLRSEQANGVHMVDEISRALPDFVWLTGMDQAGAQIKFQGQSNSLASVADFIMNLQKSGGWFPRVELDSSTEQNSVVTFQVTANFENPEVAAKARAAAAAPAPAPAAAQPPKKS